LGQSYRGTGAALVDLGRAIEGAKYLRKGLGVLESLPKENPQNLNVLSAFADSYEDLGAADEAQGRWGAALAWYRRSQQIWEDVSRQRGSLHPEDVEKPARLRQRIERCEQAERARRSS
jgi:hypothetical protein